MVSWHGVQNWPALVWQRMQVRDKLLSYLAPFEATYSRAPSRTADVLHWPSSFM
jgi:hypothetical protein